MKTVEIKKMTMADVADVATLDKECFKIPWSQNAFEAEMENAFAHYIVAILGGKCIGYCGFWQAYDEGDITNVAVNPLCRRLGIGSMLIKEIIKEARKKELVCLNLEVRKSNTPAQKLYEKYGFCIVGERKNYYSDNKEDAYIMKLTFEDIEDR